MASSKRTTLIINSAGETLASVEAYHGPASIVVKRLGWRKLVEAERLNQVRASQHVSELGGPRVFREIQEAATEAMSKLMPPLEGEAQPDARQALEAQVAMNPLASFDAVTLLYGGIDAIEGCAKQQDLGPVIDELELEIAEACAREILKLSRPSLFETEDDRKNG